MLKTNVFLAFSVVLSVSLSAFAANTLTPEQKQADLDQLVALVKSGYGPLKYKKEKFNIDPDTLRAQYAARVTETKTNAEFYYTLIRFISEFHDGHFRATVPSELKASLPFDVDLVQGKVLIDQIDRRQLPEALFPFQKGDEIVAVDNRDISTVLDELQSYRGLGFSLSERRMGAMALTVRDGKRMPIPQGDVTFKIRRGLSQVEQTAQLQWRVEGVALDELDAKSPFKGLRGMPKAQANYDELSITAMMQEVRNPNFERTFRCSGGTRIEIPAGATPIIFTPFVAYTYPTAKGRVGYLRIPHYSPEDGNYEKRFAQYEYAISILEQNTVGLVIDQDHNCGGSVEYLHQLVSLFMGEKFPAMKFQLLANKAEYLTFSSWVNQAYENTLSKIQVEKVLEMIKAAWLGGEFMTPLTAIDGDNERDPNSVRYTKPIVILIDEMSGSGGDAFPAMMKGFNRAKLIGTRTMGLGGHVVDQPALFYSRIVPQMTKSLFYRPDGVAVENNGAEPDYPYEITRDDFIYGYQGYRAFYTEKLLELIP